MIRALAKPPEPRERERLSGALSLTEKNGTRYFEQ
jgi:hypothetical protein